MVIVAEASMSKPLPLLAVALSVRTATVAAPVIFTRLSALLRLIALVLESVPAPLRVRVVAPISMASPE